MKKLSGFTLIELLIVVAIIAILAAIAVPNFLEAQTRSKVARVKSDMRLIATSLEAYYVDYNNYPQTVNFYDPLPSVRLIGMTTPIAYLTSLPKDPFDRKTGSMFEITVRSINPEEPLDNYIYNVGNSDFGLGSAGTETLQRQFSLSSSGPDLSLDFPYYAFSPIFVRTGNYLPYIYDPTNGTTSRGEIFRRGGIQPDQIPGLTN